MRTLVLLLAIACTSLSGCAVYKQHFMFQDDGTVDVQTLTDAQRNAESLYTLRPFDEFTLQVFTGDGERVIDPDFELMQGNGNVQLQGRPNLPFVVQADSTVRLPQIGLVNVANLNKQDLEIKLQKLYEEFYTDPFCLITLQNRRVIVLGASGGTIVPLENEGMTVFEVIAASGGLDESGRAYNLRLVRGPYDNPIVETIDLSTIAGIQKSQLYVQPGDVLYIEPRPQILQASFRDILPLLNLFSTTGSLVVLIITLTQANG